MNSKLELRNEAVKLAVNVEGVNTENVIEVAKKIEYYIIGGVELPEIYDISEQTQKIMSMVLDNCKTETCSGQCTKEHEKISKNEASA